jgi:hypothetical protein
MHTLPAHQLIRVNNPVRKIALICIALVSAESETCKVEALRLSRNLAYMVAQHTPGLGTGELTFKKYEKAGEVRFEHHWNNHEHCSSWCHAKSWTV